MRDVYRHPDQLGGKDWNAFLGQAQAEVTSLLDHGQFPVWNPWRRGGQVSFSQPESMFLSPVTPLALLVGVVLAFKLLLLPLFVLGCLGQHRLARSLGLQGAAALVPPLVFFGASTFVLYVNGGLPNWLAGMALLPWLVDAQRRAEQDLRFAAVAGVLLALLLWCGSIHHFVFFPLLLGIDALVRTLQLRTSRPLKALAIAGLVAAGVASVRTLPLLEVFAAYPRELPAEGRFLTVELALRALLDPRLPPLEGTEGGWLLTEASRIYWINCGSFVGPLVVLLAVVGIRRRRLRGFAVTTVVFFWLALGTGVWPSLWSALHALPVYRSMQAPERLLLLVCFGLSLLAGSGFERVQRGWRDRRRRRWLDGVALMIVVAPLFLVHQGVAAGAFPVSPSEPPDHGLRGGPRPPRPPFEQLTGRQVDGQWGGELYESVLRNQGNLAATADVPTYFAALPASDPRYRGEVYLETGGTLSHVEITPNRIDVRLHLTQADRLYVNQNYFPGWSATGTVSLPVEDGRGLLSLELPPGAHEITLRYRPARIPQGALLSIASLLLLVGYAAGVRRRGAALRVGRPEWLLIAGQIVLLAAQATLAAATAPAPLPVSTKMEERRLLTPGGSSFADVSAVARWWQARLDATRSKVLRVDPARPEAHPDLASAIAAAVPGQTVLLAAGEHAGATLDRAVLLSAETPGTVQITTPFRIHGIAGKEPLRVIGLEFQAGFWIEACTAPIVLQSLVLRPAAGAPALTTHQADHVVILGGRIEGAAAEETGVLFQDSRVVVVRTGLGDATPLSLKASGGMLFLGEARGHEGTRLTLDGTPLSAQPAREPGSPPFHLELRRSSHARFLGSFPGPVDADASSFIETVAGAVRLVLERPLRLGGESLLRIHAPPGLRGHLVVGPLPDLHEVVDSDQLLQVQLNAMRLYRPFEVPEDGQLVRRLRMPAEAWSVGDGLFFQLSWPDARVPGKQSFSLLEGSLVEPEDPRDPLR